MSLFFTCVILIFKDFCKYYTFANFCQNFTFNVNINDMYCTKWSKMNATIYKSYRIQILLTHITLHTNKLHNSHMPHIAFNIHTHPKHNNLSKKILCNYNMYEITFCLYDTKNYTTHFLFFLVDLLIIIQNLIKYTEPVLPLLLFSVNKIR